MDASQVYNEGDMVWVHGFHLLLLPSFLTRVLRTARVGLFLHTPFPSSEIFRTLPFREDLLRGMLNADKVGFQDLSPFCPIPYSFCFLLLFFSTIN